MKMTKKKKLMNPYTKHHTHYQERVVRMAKQEKPHRPMSRQKRAIYLSTKLVHSFLFGMMRKRKKKNSELERYLLLTGVLQILDGY